MNAAKRSNGDPPGVPSIPRLTTVPGLESCTCDRHLSKNLRDVTPSDGDSADTLVLVTRLDVLDVDIRCVCGKPAHWCLRTVAVIR